MPKENQVARAGKNGEADAYGQFARDAPEPSAGARHGTLVLLDEVHEVPQMRKVSARIAGSGPLTPTTQEEAGAGKNPQAHGRAWLRDHAHDHVVQHWPEGACRR